MALSFVLSFVIVSLFTLIFLIRKDASTLKKKLDVANSVVLDLEKEIEFKNARIDYFQSIHTTTVLFQVKRALKDAEQNENYEMAAYFSNIIGDIESGRGVVSY